VNFPNSQQKVSGIFHVGPFTCMQRGSGNGQKLMPL